MKTFLKYFLVLGLFTSCHAMVFKQQDVQEQSTASTRLRSLCNNANVKKAFKCIAVACIAVTALVVLANDHAQQVLAYKEYNNKILANLNTKLQNCAAQGGSEKSTRELLKLLVTTLAGEPYLYGNDQGYGFTRGIYSKIGAAL